MTLTVLQARPPSLCLEQVLGVPISIDVRDAAVDSQALDLAFYWLRHVAALFNPYNAASEISRLAKGTLTLAHASPEVREVAVRSARLRLGTGEWSLSGPGLNVDTIDLSLVTSWALQGVARLLEAAGARNYLLTAGDDCLARGLPNVAGPCWEVTIRHPLQQGRRRVEVALTDQALASCGGWLSGYQGHSQELGAETRAPVTVAVVGPDLMTAHAYASAAYAMGTETPSWASRLPGYEAITLVAGDIVQQTEAFPRV